MFVVAVAAAAWHLHFVFRPSDVSWHSIVRATLPPIPMINLIPNVR